VLVIVLVLYIGTNQKCKTIRTRLFFPHPPTSLSLKTNVDTKKTAG
jgi:hypothetical protein